MATILNSNHDRDSRPLDAPKPTDTHRSAVLTASTNTTLTVPTGSKYAIFNSTVPIFVAADATAVVPSGASFATTEGTMNPAQLRVDGVTTLNIIASTAATVSVAFYT